MLVAQLCLTLCNPVDCSPPGSSVHGILQARILKWGCHFLLEGIFPTQGSNSQLLHWQVDSLPLSHQGSPRILEWVAYPFSRGSSTGIKPGSPALQADSLSSKPLGKLKEKENPIISNNY